MRTLPVVLVLLTVPFACSSSPSKSAAKTSPPSTTASSPAPTTPTGPKVFTIRGHIDVDPSGIRGHKGRPCTSDSGYDDIQTGANVVVYDPQDVKVAIGSLGPGHYSSEVSCRFSFAVTDVPDTFPLYSVEVSHRGELTYKRADLNRPLSLVLSS